MITMAVTITDTYLEQQYKLHENPNYGVASLSFAPIVADIIKRTGCKSLSDYGAGKKRLLEGLRQAGIEPTPYLPEDKDHQSLGTSIYLPRDPSFHC